MTKLKHFLRDSTLVHKQISLFSLKGMIQRCGYDTCSMCSIVLQNFLRYKKYCFADLEALLNGRTLAAV
jgi:hypothetical protein